MAVSEASVLVISVFFSGCLRAIGICACQGTLPVSELCLWKLWYGAGWTKMDYGSSHVFMYANSDEEVISDTEYDEGMWLR